MAETKLEGAMRAPGAAIAKIGEGWGISASRATADDPKLHLPLSTPGGNPPAPYVPPPPQPSEAEHRAALGQAVEAQKAAEARITAASEAHGRALRLVEERRQALAGYATLDDDRLAQTLTSLRDDDGSVSLPGADERLIKREIARLDLEDAERAAETLLHELVLTREQADTAAKQANMLATSVLSHIADRLADEHAALIAQAAVRKEMLIEFDQFIANSGARMSSKVQSILLANGTAGIAALTRLRDISTWQRARAKLLADPHAEIVIDAPTPAKPTSTAWPVTPVRPAVITNREVISAKDLTMEGWEALLAGRKVTAGSA